MRARIARTLRLAEDLGARVVTIPGHSVAATVLEYARTHNITKIIAGKPLRSRWQEWLHGAIVDQLIRDGGAIDVYVVSSEAQATSAPAALLVPPSSLAPLPPEHLARRRGHAGRHSRFAASSRR